MDAPINKDTICPSPVIHIGTDDVRKKMGEILDCVNLRGDEFVIERKQKPLAVLVSVQKHAALEKLSRSFLASSLNRKGVALSQEDVDAIADQAKHEART